MHYYRESLVRPSITVTDLEKLINEILSKYGGKGKEIYLGRRVDFNWNHRVDGFRTSSKNGRVLVKVYWQGDSTDGDDYVYLTDVLRNGTDVIRAEHHWLGDRTYEVHSDIRVEKYEVESLVKELAKWLSPSEVKERKIAAELIEVEMKIDNKLSDLYTRYASKWGRNEEYYNGSRAVREWVQKTNKELLKMNLEDVLKIVETIFLKNKRSDSYFGTNWNGDRTKPYDLTY